MLLSSIISQLIAIALSSSHWNLVLLSRISIISLIYSIILTYNVYYVEIIGLGLGIYNGFLQVTSLTQFVDIFIFLLGILILGITGFYHVDKDNSRELTSLYDFKQHLEYPVLSLFLLFGSQILVSSLNVITFYLSLELQSFSLYILSSLRSSKQGLKYFLLGALSSCFILLGFGLVYSYTGITSLESLAIFSKVNLNIYMQISLLICVLGILFKIGIVPFHQWAIDVYDGVPTIITTWLTTLTKISLLIFLMEFIYHHSSENWTTILMLLSVLSVIVGSLLGLSQSRIKRLLIYSMVSHVGFLMLSLSIMTEKSLEAFLFYLVQYSITNLNVFLILIAMGYFYKNPDSEDSPIIYINSLRGLVRVQPLLSICLAISLLSLGGIPPFIGFFGKLNILYSTITQGYLFISILLVLASVLSISYYLKVVQLLFVGESSLSFRNIQISTYLSTLIGVLTLMIAMFLVNPDFILQLINITICKYFIL
uniref:NADH-ubiquinone oxidoreductase chain 2 n=1 Tax=Pneumocystis carinii TaxID=4754 RepID=D2XDV9_PNECA|nr:NADH dehydrogenase subunit 2 [Pneumocystis carinii]ACZ82949.1 NADH dehydrogenase subunit 2 [Pneumocystis carinii]AFR90432.1 NADH dehydrogenase subunit 2 [Pneumocystis carinii]